MITLQEILNTKTDRFRNTNCKLVRHAGGGERYRELTKEKHGLLKDQHNQDSDVFKSSDYILSFIGMQRRRSLLVGIYSVVGVQQVKGRYIYDLTELTEFDDLVDRVIIDWGNNVRVWCQSYDKQPKEIVEILPKGYMGGFPGLLDFVLDFEELKRLIDNPEANHDWKHHLAAVNGIYLILDSLTGQQYIGSAYGGEGIWQRWDEYARTRTGGNKELIRLLDGDPNYQRHFRYSILQTLPSNVTQREIVAIESLYKQKLGSKVHGLNAN